MAYLATFLAALMLFAPLTPGLAARTLVRTTTFTPPDIRNDFCGVHINFQYCKCAFHDQYCGAIGMDQNGADAHVNAQFGAYVDGLRATFIENCEAGGGELNAGSDECRYYEEEPEEAAPTATEEEEEEKACELPDDFEDDWRKYSDFDAAIPTADASHEVRQYHEALDKLETNAEARYLIRRDMEIDRLMRLELREYKKALVQDLKTNLLKAFWRLAWITYDTTVGASVPGKKAQGMTGLGMSYKSLFDDDVHKLSKLATGLKTMRALTPADSKVALDTKRVGGQLQSAGVTGTIEILENLGNIASAEGAVKVAGALVGEAQARVLPSADLTQEEFDVLADQHIDNLLVDNALQESYRQAREYRMDLEVLEAEYEDHVAELHEWEAAEKERVKNGILESCTE